MRLIDADALMEALGITDMDCDKCEWQSGYGSYCSRGSDFTDACTAIEDAPTIEPQRWIPVTERLPEETATYICTCFDGIANRVTFINFQKRYASWNLTGQRAYWKVIAWQPLPEPWKGES